MNHRTSSGRLRWFFHVFLVSWCALVASGHPVPDLPVRSYFGADGGLEIRVEVDPRSFADDPEAEEYLTKEVVEKMGAEAIGEMHARADVYLGQRLRFLFEPMGEVKGEFAWGWRTLGDLADLAEAEDQSVLVGSWKTTVAEGISGYRVHALKLGEETMGIPLNVVFLNFIDGVQAERYAVLFPGETSYAFDVSGLGAGAVRAEGSSGMEATGGEWWSIFGSEVKRGFLHVVPLGLDHILFVLGVFLLTRKAKPLLLQISAFTVAHTLTLWMASAGVVVLSAKVVEPIIAASIVVVAVENIFHRKYTHWRLVVVFGFGLIHGLGFAGVMSTKLDSTTALVVGLLGINLGVEIGQLAVIAVALLATFWISDQAKYRKFVVVPGSVLIALAGVWWVLERTVF